MNEVQEDIERQMKQRNCCCIPLIYFTQHSGVPGYLALGESTSINIGYLDMLRDEMKIAAEKQFLKYVSKKMCKGGKIVFMQCMSGEGEDGERLEKWLKGIIGNDIKLELFKTKVRWCRRRIVEAK